MKHSKLIMGVLAAAAAACISNARVGATIVGSPHDFTTQTNFWVSGTTNWVPHGDVCEECHTPHKAQASYQTAGPLWAHPEPNGIPTYVPYNSPQLVADGVSGQQPGWASLACLSCHDGNIALNQMSGSANYTGGAAVKAPSWAIITTTNGAGNNLSGTHPIGIKFDTAQGIDTEGLNASGTTISSTPGGSAAGNDSGKTISQLMLFNESTVGGGANMLECASCHDIHQIKGNSATVSDSLIVGTTTSTQPLCLTCHIK